MPSYVLNAVKSLSNYGIVISGSTTDPAFTKGYFFSSPNVSIIGSSCYIDYSNTTNISDLTYILKLFSAAPNGTTFSLSYGDYYDEEKNIRTDISGVFSKNNVLNNNKIIVGNIVSGFTFSTSYSCFNSNCFINSPQYSTNYSGTTGINYIINNLPNNTDKSFINCGPIGSCYGKEEYVEISGSTVNSGKLKVNSIIKLKDDKEILYIDNTLTNENLGNTFTTATFYLRGNANPEILSKSRKTTGCYVVYDENGNQINCFEKQNELQAFLRSQFENSNYTADWIVCDSCSSLTSSSTNAASADKTFIYDASIFAKINQTTDNNGNPVYSLFFNYPTCYTLKQSSIISFSLENGFKLDLSHPTLKGYKVLVYSESSKTNLVTQNLYYVGTPGYDQSSIFYIKAPSSPRNLYINFIGPANFETVIVVN